VGKKNNRSAKASRLTKRPRDYYGNEKGGERITCESESINDMLHREHVLPHGKTPFSIMLHDMPPVSILGHPRPNTELITLC
jgi:hypothetical protein